MSALRNLSLRATISLLVAIAVIFVAVALFAVVAWRLASDVSAEALKQERASIAVVAALLERQVPTSRVEWNADGSVRRVVAEAIPPVTDQAPIDLVKTIARSEATIFAYDAAKDDYVRVTTSVKKPDGTRATGTYLGHDSAAYASMKAGTIFIGEANVLGKPHYAVYLPIVDDAGKPVGIYFAGIDKASVSASANQMIRHLGIAALAVLVILLPAAFFVARRLIAPVRVLATVTKALAADELDTPIPYSERRTELGDMARAMAVFRDGALERRRLMAEHKSDAASKEARRHGLEAAIAGFRTRAGELMNEVRAHVDTLIATATTVDTASRTTSGDAETAASASVLATENVDGVASAAEELTQSIQEITEQVSRTTAVVGEATETTDDADAKVSRLAMSASRIGEVVTLIQSIAAQTNLLALNATIEAARAGEAGKGFAVVATEVKSLATQTAKATEDIAGQVSDIQTETSTAVIAIQRIGEIMKAVDGYTTAIAAAVGEQGASTAEIARSIAEASRGTREVNDRIGTLAATARTTKTSAEEVEASSRVVAERTDELRRSIDAFLEDVAV
jgi:methyl-accepting chemotaxis protein